MIVYTYRISPLFMADNVALELRKGDQCLTIRPSE
jgi:hypothetical protein